MKKQKGMDEFSVHTVSAFPGFRPLRFILLLFKWTVNNCLQTRGLLTSTSKTERKTRKKKVKIYAAITWVKFNLISV